MRDVNSVPSPGLPAQSVRRMITMVNTAWFRVMVAASLCIVSGCGEDDVGTPSVVDVVDVVDNVEYYGACGNETLVVGSSTFYPLLPDERAALDTSKYPLNHPNGLVSGIGGKVRVQEPEPGDDIGTLTVYSDGIARFESDSGRIVWLSTDQRTYDWDC